MPIHVLSQSLINKIAAGEVIERPASVVKELMENAVDAGATRIDVSVGGGGIELVRVADNGCGIPAEELPLAVTSHATSKLETADDLFRVSTMGFRGEALASIAEISHTTIRSRTQESPSGAELEVVAGQRGEIVPYGGPVGTTIEVCNLFFNTPVRRRFLRSVQTELGHVAEAFTRIALAAPEIHFTLRHNERVMFDVSATEGWLERIARFYGRELADALIWVDNRDGDVRLSGYVADPSQSRSHNRMQYLFLNRRHIRDRSLQHALGEAYRGLLMTGRFAIAFLALEMPAEMVDVNVHPTKLEVRFQDSGRLYSQLLSTLRTKFLSSDLTPRMPAGPAADPSGAHDELQAVAMRQQVVDWAKGKIATWDMPASGGRAASVSDFRGFGGDSPARRPLDLTTLDRSWPAVGAEEPEPARFGDEADDASAVPAAGLSPLPQWSGLAQEPAQQRPLSALQVHNSYLVAESAEGVVVIDQHALHERILYEQLRTRIAAGTIETQNLLVPEPVDLAPAEAAAVVEHRGVLAQLGLKIEPFGGDTVLLNSYPAMLANLNPVDVLHGLVDKLMAGGKSLDQRDLLDELLHSIACKAAVKAGDRLAPEEISALLAQRHLIDDSHHCPHGRPTALVFTKEELDKQFKRV
jgi:DNA mismatch repair protein MutL